MFTESCQRLLDLAKARGCYAMTIQVRADGRVDIIGMCAKGTTRFSARSDLLPGGPDPTPDVALFELENS